MDTLRYAAGVAQNVSKAIDSSGMTILAISEKTGIPRTTLMRRLEHPESSPFDVTKLARIAFLTRKSVSSLMRVKTAVESS